MMNSPALGIAYVIWLKARWVIGGMLLFILLLALAIRLILFPDVVQQILCGALLLLFAWAALLNVLIYSPTDLGSKGSVFPAHMLVLPVRTRTLVGWTMLYGTAIHAGLWVLLAATVLRPGGIDAPLVWPAVVLSALGAWVQAIAWSPFPSPFVRVPALFIAICPIGLLAKWVIFHNAASTIAVWSIVGIIAWTLVAYVVGAFGLTQVRAGNGWDWARLFSGRQPALSVKLQTGATRVLPPLLSADAAQLWYERRRNVGFLPGMFGFVAIPLLVMQILMVRNSTDNPGLTIGSINLQPNVITLAALLFVPLMFSAMASPNMGKFDLWAAEAITPFFAARPMTTRQLVGNKIKASIHSALIAWIMVLILLVSWAILDAHAADQQKSLVRGFMAQATAKQMVGVALAVVGLLLIMWRNLAVGMWPSLTGRKWVATVLGLLAAGGVFAAPGIVGWIVHEPTLKEQVLRSLPWIMGALVALKLGTAAAVATQLLHRELMASREILLAALIWLAAVTILLGIFACFNQWTWNLAAGAILLVPLVRIGMAPLALNWNRHR